MAGRAIKREHFVALTVAISLHAGLAAALTLSTPPEPLEIKLDLGFEMVELSPLEAPVTPSTPLRKEVMPTPTSEPPPQPQAIAQAEPAPPVKELPEPVPEPVIPEIVKEPVPEVASIPEPQLLPEPTPVETAPEKRVMLTDTRDALTAEQTAELPLLVASIDDDYIPPLSHSRYLHNPKPLYPRAARTRGMEGMVMINVRVSRDGHPIEALIHTSSGYGVLDRAALKAVRGWRFEAARRGNARVEGEVLVPIHFELKQS